MFPIQLGSNVYGFQAQCASIESKSGLTDLIGLKEFENKAFMKMPPPHTTEKLYSTFILSIDT